MAITTLDGIVAGAQYPREFMKAVTGTLVAGRPHTLNMMAGIPSVSVIGTAAGNLPNVYFIQSATKASPSVITLLSMPFANGDKISIIGTNSVAPVDGNNLTVAGVSGNTFNVGLNVLTTAGTVSGVACGITGGGGTGGLDGYALTSFSGQIPFSNPGAGNTYLSRFLGFSHAQAGVLLLCDRLWHNGGYAPTLTTIQPASATGTVAALPARDANGQTNGVGVFAALEIYTATSSGTPTPTLVYTNSSGVGSHSATTLTAMSNPSIAGTFHPFALQAGDVGVQACTQLTVASSLGAAAAYGLVLYRVLARLELPSAIPNAIDCITGGFARMYDNSCPFIVFIPNTTTTTNISGQVIWTQG